MEQLYDVVLQSTYLVVLGCIMKWYCAKHLDEIESFN